MSYHFAYGTTYEELPKSIVITDDDIHGYVYVLERTCHDTGECRWFHCSKCGCGLSDVYLNDETRFIEGFPRFCPNCGARVVPLGLKEGM